MAFDPTKPANNSPVSSAELRSQLTSLKALIDTKADAAAVSAQIGAETSGSMSGVAYPSVTISNPPTQAEVLALANKIVEMLDAANRA